MGQQGNKPKNGKQQSGSQEQQAQARDARQKRMQAEQMKKNAKGDPKSGEKNPQDPAKRLGKNGTSDDPKTDQPKRGDDLPGWVTALPPEIRDALDAGRGEDIPQKYRHLVRRYNLLLQKIRTQRDAR